MCTTTHSSQATASNIHAPVEQDGNAIRPVSNQQFALTAVLGVPFWLTVLLPVTVLYQAGKAVVDAVSPKNDESESEINLDSGYKVDQTDIVPRPDRTYDVVVLGATGFTGRLAALHLANTYGCNGDGDNVRWAIAGRSKEKLEAVKQSLADELKNPDILNIPILIVDTSIPATLPRLVRDTRAVVTTVGPFRKYGSSVVEFCAKFGTHYADITGETDWGQTMMNQWQDTAKRSGAKIIHFCGHDSIPWDLSVYKLAQLLQEEKQEDLSSVSCFNELNSKPSGGTLETMKLALTGKGLPDRGQSKAFRATPEGRMHTEKFSANLPFSIQRLELPWLENHPELSAAYGSPFVMSMVNAKVVSWTQALRQGAPLSYSECAASPDFKSAFVSYFGTIAFFTALFNPITAFLLTKFVLLPPGQGPSMNKMTNHSYCSIYAKGVGTGGTKVESLIYFDKCAGYLETARMVTESGLSMALSEDKLTSKGGGFFSPAYGLGDVLLDRLTQTGTKFTVRFSAEENQK
jgi:short subunit dehydrogenase-like uncharacterized protein